MSTPVAQQRELRLAVVMNGGVSLAVWMGGVTAELDNLRTAEASTRSGVAQAWTDILQAGGYSKVVVDVVAGTSAGGINGVMLATAIARGAHLPSLRDLWVEEASLEVGKLLREPPLPGRSFLNGEFFEGLLLKVLRGISPSPHTAQDITLLITSTALRPHMETRGTGVATVRTADSRRVFRFERRRPMMPAVRPSDPSAIGTDHFEAGNTEDLARAGRASASFPGAFQPVQATPFMTARETDERGGPGEYLMDGGVLDNAPFEPVLDELSKRVARAPFQRGLLYVKPTSEPPPSAPDESSPLDLRRMPSPLLAAFREPDARSDAEALEDRFEVMQFTASDPSRVLLHCLTSDTHRGRLLASARNLMWLYQPARSQARAVPKIVSWRKGGEPDFDRHSSSPVDPAVPTAFDPLNGAGEWMWGIGTAERVLTWWSRALNAGPPTDTSASAMRHVGDALERVGGIEGMPPAERACLLWPVMEGAARTVAPALTPTLVPRLTPERLINVSLAVEVVACSMRWGNNWGLDVRDFSYHEVTPAAPSLLDLSAVCEGVDPPVSPEAFASNWPSRKLYGERWGHFGAFASSSGRESDWLWGRLDGASALADMILGGPAPVADADRARLKAALADAILQDEAPKGRSRDEVRDGVLAGAARLYALDSAGLLRELQGQMTSEARRAIADLVVGLPAANVGPMLGANSAMAALLGVTASDDHRGWLSRMKLMALGRVGRFLRGRAHRRVERALRG